MSHEEALRRAKLLDAEILRLVRSTKLGSEEAATLDQQAWELIALELENACAEGAAAERASCADYLMRSCGAQLL